MHASDLVTLYDYNYWANDRILAASADLQPQQFLAPSTLSWGSLRDVLVHTLGAEWIWRVRCEEAQAPRSLPQPADFPTYDTLVARWQIEESAMRAYVASLDDGAVNSPITYRTTSGKSYSMMLWQILAHVVNHGTHHRAELAHLLTSYGHSPGDIDLVVYLRQVSSA